jgi:hypothetical protein
LQSLTSSIVLSNTSLTVTTPQNWVFWRESISERVFFSNLNIVSENVTSAGSEPLWWLNSTFLQFGNVNLPISRFWTFCILRIGQEDRVDIESMAVKSLLFFVPSPGNSSLLRIERRINGFLRNIDRSSFIQCFHPISLSFLKLISSLKGRPLRQPLKHHREGTLTVSLSVDFHFQNKWSCTSNNSWNTNKHFHSSSQCDFFSQSDSHPNTNEDFYGSSRWGFSCQKSVDPLRFVMVLWEVAEEFWRKSHCETKKKCMKDNRIIRQRSE